MHYRSNARRGRHFDDEALGPDDVQVIDPPGCPHPRQESDEYVCGKCRLRWDTHEDKPACPQA